MPQRWVGWRESNRPGRLRLEIMWRVIDTVDVDVDVDSGKAGTTVTMTNGR